MPRCPRCHAMRSSTAPEEDLCPGCLLATALAVADEPCPYQVLAPLAQDAAGVTYLAQPLRGESNYIALKIYQPRVDTDEILARYKQWKPALERVGTPHVTIPRDMGLTAKGRLFTARDYVAGRPLTRLDSPIPVEVDVRARMARRLADAVDAMHAVGVAHLRLEPSRVIVSGQDPHIVGLGTCLVVDGANPKPEADLAALASLIQVVN